MSEELLASENFDTPMLVIAAVVANGVRRGEFVALRAFRQRHFGRLEVRKTRTGFRFGFFTFLYSHTLPSFPLTGLCFCFLIFRFAEPFAAFPAYEVSRQT